MTAGSTGAVAARPVIAQFLDDLWTQTGLAPEQTVLAGFSQGAMMALHAGLSLDRRLAGILAFSGACCRRRVSRSREALRPPVALIHGEFDEVVEPDLSRDAETALKAAGYDVDAPRFPRNWPQHIHQTGSTSRARFLRRAFGS